MSLDFAKTTKQKPVYLVTLQSYLWEVPDYFQGFSSEELGSYALSSDRDEIENSVFECLPNDLDFLTDSNIEVKVIISPEELEEIEEDYKDKFQAVKDQLASDFPELTEEELEEKTNEEFDYTLYLWWGVKVSEETVKFELSERCELREGYSWNAEDDPYYQIPLTTCGDYVGSLVERSNMKVLEDTFDFVTIQSWPYSTETAVIWFSDLEFICDNPEKFHELLEMLDGLENYPLLDEGQWSEEESEATSEAWENCYCSDFRRELVKIAEKQLSKYFDLHTFDKGYNCHYQNKKAEAVQRLIYKIEDKLTDENLWEACRALEDKTNTYWENESGNSMYIDLDRLLKPVFVKIKRVKVRKGYFRTVANLCY